MADNVQGNPGTGGATWATDEVNTGSGLAHVQLVKLLSGADGSTERFGGDAANGLDVDITRIAAGTNLIGDVGIGARTSGGLSLHSAVAPNNTTAVTVKSSAGQVFGYQLFNVASAPRYLKLYDTSGTPTSSDTPVRRIMIPAQSSGGGGAGIESQRIQGIPFASAIKYRITTGIADNDNAAPGSSEVLVNIDYK